MDAGFESIQYGCWAIGKSLQSISDETQQHLEKLGTAAVTTLIAIGAAIPTGPVAVYAIAAAVARFLYIMGDEFIDLVNKLDKIDGELDGLMQADFHGITAEGKLAAMPPQAANKPWEEGK